MLIPSNLQYKLVTFSIAEVESSPFVNAAFLFDFAKMLGLKATMAVRSRSRFRGYAGGTVWI